MTKFSGGEHPDKSIDGDVIPWGFLAHLWTRWSHISSHFFTILARPLSLHLWTGQNGSGLRVCAYLVCSLFFTDRILGYWFLDDADVGSKKWQPSADLINFIDKARKSKKKIIYIGFGSIVVSDPKSMTRTVIDAILRSGVHAILSKGWSDRLSKNTTEATEPEEPLPQEIYPVSSVPHDWLFKQIDAACHHGGAGTTGASLRGM